MQLRPLVCLIVLALAGCDSGPDPGRDGGGVTLMDGRVVQPDSATPARDGGGGGDPDGGCAANVEICGDHMDQNCDGRDQSCGDTDADGWQACRPGDDLSPCDCNDSRSDAFPPAGAGVPGAPEVCYGIDNDCNGRIDESAECCAGCASLDDRRRADICTPSGVCDCSTVPGEGPCPSGQTCCSGGCVDTQTDFENCGYCNTRCTPSADRCTAGSCMCGSGPVCDLDYPCNSGSCG